MCVYANFILFFLFKPRQILKYSMIEMEILKRHLYIAFCGLLTFFCITHQYTCELSTRERQTTDASKRRGRVKQSP